MAPPTTPRPEGAAPIVHFLPTDDGWLLALHHFSPKQPMRQLPVLMVHGIAANRLHFDLDVHYSLARTMRDAGFEVFVLELRGAGESRLPKAPFARHVSYGFADYAERDLPTAIEAIFQLTQKTSVHGIGHSMGGMLLLSTAARAPKALSSVTTIGTPLVTTLADALGPRERRLLQVASRLSPAAKFTPPSQRRVPLRRLLGAAGLMMPISSRLADNLLLNVANSEPYVLARLAREGIHDIPVQLVTEITQQMQQKASAVGPYSYEELLDAVRAPTLVLGGRGDRIAPPGAVDDLVARLHPQELNYRQLGLSHGDRCDYGHIDLLLGTNAPDEVYPLVLDFVREVDKSLPIALPSQSPLDSSVPQS